MNKAGLSTSALNFRKNKKAVTKVQRAGQTLHVPAHSVPTVALLEVGETPFSGSKLLKSPTTSNEGHV